MKNGTGFRTVCVLFCLGLFLLPFNNIPIPFRFFGEFAREASFYPIFAALLLWPALAGRSKETLPASFSFYLLAGLAVWVLVSGLLNCHGIAAAFFQERSGFNKFALQACVLLTGIAVVCLSSGLSGTGEFQRLFKTAVFSSLAATGAYGALELTYLFCLNDGILLANLNGFINAAPGMYFRVRSVSTESSWFAISLAFAYPFLYARSVFSGRSAALWRLANIFYTILFVLMLSRTGAGVFWISVLSVTMAAFSLPEEKYIRQALVSLMLIVSSYLGVQSLVNSYCPLLACSKICAQYRLETYARSNDTRYNGMMAAVKLGLDRPFFGAGFGQYGFEAGKYFRKETLDSNPELAYYWKEAKAWPVSYVLYARILAETGFPGLMLWLAVWLYAIAGTFRALRCGAEPAAGAALLAVLCNMTLVGLAQDSFRYLGYWAALGLAYSYSKGGFRLYKI